MSTHFSLMDQFKARRNLRNERKYTRRSVQSQGWIRLDGNFAVRPCVVVDMSPAGARLRVDSPSRITDRFNLLLSRHEANGRRCQVKWRRGAYLGVVFL